MAIYALIFARILVPDPLPAQNVKKASSLKDILILINLFIQATDLLFVLLMDVANPILAPEDLKSICALMYSLELLLDW